MLSNGDSDLQPTPQPTIVDALALAHNQTLSQLPLLANYQSNIHAYTLALRDYRRNKAILASAASMRTRLNHTLRHFHHTGSGLLSTGFNAIGSRTWALVELGSDQIHAGINSILDLIWTQSHQPTTTTITTGGDDSITQLVVAQTTEDQNDSLSIIQRLRCVKDGAIGAVQTTVTTSLATAHTAIDDNIIQPTIQTYQSFKSTLVQNPILISCLDGYNTHIEPVFDHTYQNYIKPSSTFMYSNYIRPSGTFVYRGYIQPTLDTINGIVKPVKKQIIDLCHKATAGVFVEDENLDEDHGIDQDDGDDFTNLPPLIEIDFNQDFSSLPPLFTASGDDDLGHISDNDDETASSLDHHQSQ